MAVVHSLTNIALSTFLITLLFAATAIAQNQSEINGETRKMKISSSSNTTTMPDPAMAMSVANIDRRLYSRCGWARDDDIILVRLLDVVACRNGLRNVAAVRVALQTLSARMSTALRKTVSERSLVKSLAFIRRRYLSFKAFLELPGVVYDVRRNRVCVTRPYWRNLDGRNESMLERNMRLRGEPLYTQLRNIFQFGRCVTIPQLDRHAPAVTRPFEGDVIHP